MDELSRKDIERISLYLDGELSPEEAAEVETAIAESAVARETYEELRVTRELLATLPEVRIPRSFTLTPEDAGIRQRPPAYPVLRFATVLAAFFFVVLVGLDVLASGLTFGASAPAMAPQMELAAPADEMLSAEQDMVSVPEEEVVEGAPAELGDAVLDGVGESLQENAAEGRAVADEPQPPSAEAEAPLAEEPSYAATSVPTTSEAEALELEQEKLAAGEGVDEVLPAPELIAPESEPPIVSREVPASELDTSAFRFYPRTLLCMLEISLGLAIILLAGLTIYYRRRS